MKKSLTLPEFKEEAQHSDVYQAWENTKGIGTDLETDVSTSIDELSTENMELGEAILEKMGYGL